MENRIYFLLIVQNNDVGAISRFTNYDSALAAFHHELAYRHESRISTICSILDDHGVEVRREEYNQLLDETPQ